jgi:Tol biopolymer transport system component
MLDVSGSGLLAWIRGSVTPEEPGTLAWFDQSGKETPVDLQKGMLCLARISPGGEKLLVSRPYAGRQLEVLDLSRGGRRNVSFEMNPEWAIWGPGPDRITFTSSHEGPQRIYSRKIDAGPEVVETLWNGNDNTLVGLGSWSRDGKTLAFIVRDKKNGPDIWLLENGKDAQPFIASRFAERHPDISPDGRWLLYSSNEPGRPEVFVKALSGQGPARQVSVASGFEPLWSRDGSTIFYWAFYQETGGRMTLFRVPVSSAGDGLSFGRPERLLETEKSPMAPGHGWDVGPDGRFLVAKPPDKAEHRAYLEKTLSDRFRVDVGGLPGLLKEREKKP